MKNLFPCAISSTANDQGLKVAKVADSCQVYFVGEHSQNLGFVTIPAEDILLSEKPFETSAINQFRSKIKETWLSGHGMEVIVDAGVEFVVAVSQTSFDKMQLQPGKEIWLTFKASAVKFLAG